MERARLRLDDWSQANLNAWHRFHAGDSAGIELERVDDEYADVVGGELLGRARRELEEATGTATKAAWRHLIRGLEPAVLATACARLERKFRAREAAQTAVIKDQRRSLFAWRARLGTIADRDHRRRVEDLLDRGLDELNPLRAELFVHAGEKLRELGYSSRRAWLETIRPGVDLAHWAGEASRVLTATEHLYDADLGDRLARIGLAPGGARTGDAEHLAALPRYLHRLPAADRKAALRSVAFGLWLTHSEWEQTRFDDAGAQHNTAAARCYPVGVPADVRALLLPRSGVRGYETLFDLAGQSLGYALTSPALDSERRRVFDPALVGTWGGLFAGRLHDPAWVEQSPLREEDEPFLNDMRWRRLLTVRRLAATARFEIEVVSLETGADPTSLADRFADELTLATRFATSPSPYLGDAIEPFTTALDALRATCLVAQVEEHLRDRFGTRFWTSSEWGQFMRELWANGGTYTAEEVAQELGLGPITAERLLADLVR